jgi:predicted PurR-regulated permease PerM
MQTKIMERNFFFGLLLTTLVFTFFIFKPFWIVLVLGISISIVLYPLYEWFKNKKFPNWLSSLFTVIILTIIICGPLLGIGAIIFHQSQDVYNSVVSSGNTGPFINSIGEKINNLLPEGITFDINEKVSGFISSISNNITKIFSTTLSTFFSFVLMLLSVFYFLKDGEKWKKAIVSLSPLSDNDDKKIIVRLSSSINGIMKEYLFIALIQGLLMGIGLWIFGVPNPAIWGVVAAIVSMIPTFGTAIVSIPSIIFLYATGHFSSALGLLIWSVIIVGLIDNLLNPIFVAKKVNIPPFLVLFSVLGGVVLLGPIGVLIGPVVISLLFTLISIYRNEFKQNTIL